MAHTYLSLMPAESVAMTASARYELRVLRSQLPLRNIALSPVIGTTQAMEYIHSTIDDRLGRKISESCATVRLAIAYDGPSAPSCHIGQSGDTTYSNVEPMAGRREVV